MIPHVERAIVLADHENSRLPPEAISLLGYGTPKVSHLLNNLCALPDCRYLEFGTLFGRSLAAAAWLNEGQFTGVDNLSQIGLATNLFKPKDTRDRKTVVREEQARILGQIPNREHVRIVEMDFRVFGRTEGLTYDVFFYDAEHTFEVTRAGVSIGSRMLAPGGILVVDDYRDNTRFPDVERGATAGVQTAERFIQQSWFLSQRDGYHCGLFVAVLS